MKSTLCIYLIIAVVIITSCSHCEDDAADNIAVQYRIHVDEPIITEIEYINAYGQVVSENITGESVTVWHRTEFVDESFNAYKRVKFLNVSNGPVNYTLRLFVGGNLVHKKEGSVLPESGGTDEIQYSVLD